MTELAQSIEPDISEKLKDLAYRRRFFLAEGSADLAQQLIKLRKRRGLNQGQLAARVGTKQPAISRMEQADYQHWSFDKIRQVVDELDGRLKVIIEASEDVLPEYKAPKAEPKLDGRLANENAQTNPLESALHQGSTGGLSAIPPVSTIPPDNPTCYFFELQRRKIQESL